MKGIIYKFTNKINNLSYIGQTLYPEARKIAHERSGLTDKFHTALRYYGLMNFEYSIIENNVPEEKLDEREVYWINYYDSYNNGYNSTLGENQYLKRLTKKYKVKKRIRLPFGYKFDKNNKPIKDKENAKIVYDIFIKYINGSTINMLGEEYKRSIDNILNNKKYYDKTDNIPPIITKEIFDKAKTNRRNRSHHTKKTHPLKGILYDESGNLYSTNNSIKTFVSKGYSTGVSIQFKDADLLMSNLDCKYDKIICYKESKMNKKFDIYYKDEYIKSILIDSFHHIIIKL